MPPISDLFRATFRFYRAYAPLLGGYLAWLLVPYTCLALLQLVPLDRVRDVGSFVFDFATGMIGIWIFILLAQLVHGLIHGKEIAPSDLRAQTRKLFLPVVTVGFLYSLIVFGGILLLIIPGILFLVWFGLAQLAVILEQKRGREAFMFSKSLVKGRFFRAAAILYAGPLAFSLGLLIATISVGTIISSIGGIPLFTPSGDAPLWFDIIDTLLQVFVFIPIMITYSVFAYDVLKHEPTVK